MSDKNTFSEKTRKEILRWLNPLAWQVKAEREPQLWDTLLQARGLKQGSQRDKFFSPEEIPFHDPFLFRDMHQACDLLRKHIRAGKKDFLIFGDYDADGFCAASILYRYFCAIGIKPRVLIPERLTEGYDLNLEQVATILEDPPHLLITVDCGTNAEESVQALLAAGVSVIISDHHQALSLPDRTLCPYINPIIADETYPFPFLSGAGVALKLALAFSKDYPVSQGTLDTLYTLAAVATVADIMPLQDENRHLVWSGIQFFPQAAPPGLLQLAHKRDISSQLFSFYIGPRLNAAGRMGQADVALDLLLSDDAEESQSLAEQLENLNQQRKSIEEDIFVKAVSQLEDEYPEKKPPLVLVHGKDWHLGVLGIVASRLTEHYRCPALVLSETGNILKGSGRSYANFNLLASLDFAADHLLQYGGHEQACGIQLLPDQLDDLKQSLQEYISEHPQSLTAQPLIADCLLDINEISVGLIEELEKFEPFGQANPAPVFIIPNLLLEQIYTVGQGRHLRLSVNDGSSGRINMIAFNLGHEIIHYQAGDRIDVLGIAEINDYMGTRRPQVRIEAIRPADEDALSYKAIADWLAFLELREKGCKPRPMNESDSLSADIFPFIWQLLNAIGGRGQEAFIFKPSRMARLLREGYNIFSSELSLLLALSVLEEAGLICLMLEEDAGALLISIDIPEETKPRLRETSTWLLLEQCGGIKE